MEYSNKEGISTDNSKLTPITINKALVGNRKPIREQHITTNNREPRQQDKIIAQTQGAKTTVEENYYSLQIWPNRQHHLIAIKMTPAWSFLTWL